MRLATKRAAFTALLFLTSSVGAGVALGSFQFTTPDSDYICGDVELGEQCGNESQTTSCGSEGSFCSWCAAPNPTAFVKRCLPSEGSECLNSAGTGPKDVDCGERMYGECDGSGACDEIGPSGSNCGRIKSVGCEAPA